MHKLIKGIRGFLKALFRGSEQPEARVLNSILIERHYLALIRKEYGLSGAQHIIDVLRLFANRTHNLEIAEYFGSPYGDYYIIREQHGPLGSKKVQIVVFESPVVGIYFVAAVHRRWTRSLPDHLVEEYGKKFNGVEKSRQRVQ